MWQALLGPVLSIIEKVLPDPKAAAEAKLRLIELQQQGELAQLDADVRLALGQMEINKEEAASADNFRGGWRPAVGWVCVFGLCYTYLLRPLLPWVVTVLGYSVPPLPAIDNTELFMLLMGMLGLSTNRMFEKIKGKA